MNETAKQTLEKLKVLDKDLSDKFNSYVSLLAEELEIPESIAVTLVTTELVNRNEKKLILLDMFSKKTLEKVKL